LADLIANGVPTYVVIDQLQVECETGKVKTGVLPLCHAARYNNSSQL